MNISINTLNVLADSGDQGAQVARRYHNMLQMSPINKGKQLKIIATDKGYFVGVHRQHFNYFQ